MVTELLSYAGDGNKFNTLANFGSFLSFYYRLTGNIQNPRFEKTVLYKNISFKETMYQTKNASTHNRVSNLTGELFGIVFVPTSEP